MKKRDFLFNIVLLVVLVFFTINGPLLQPVSAESLNSTGVSDIENEDPVADPQTIVAPQGYFVPITLTGSDPDGDTLTFIVVDDPQHGTLSGSAPYLTYQSDADYEGSDSFQFVVTDGIGESEPAKVGINVRANQDPIADPQTIAAPQGYFVPITLTGSDPDGDALTFIVVDDPQHGTLSGSAPYLTYQSDADYEGPDSFQFVVTDNIGESLPAKVSITVSANADPVADPQTIVARQGDPVQITLTGSDPDGDSLRFIVVDYPKHGTLTGTGANLTYQSDADYEGPDSFQFVVTDDIGESMPAKVRITVRENEDQAVRLRRFTMPYIRFPFRKGSMSRSW